MYKKYEKHAKQVTYNNYKDITTKHQKKKKIKHNHYVPFKTITKTTK